MASMNQLDARAHLQGEDDGLVKVEPLLERFGEWGEFLAEAPSGEAIATLRRHERTGRPLGSMSFIADLESQLSRVLRPQKPGRKRKAK